MSRLFCISVKVFCLSFYLRRNIPQKRLILWKIAQRNSLWKFTGFNTVRVVEDADPYEFYSRSVRDCRGRRPRRPFVTLRDHLIHRRSAVPLPLEGKARVVEGADPYEFYSRSARDSRGRRPRRPFFTLRDHLIHRHSAVPLPLEGKARVVEGARPYEFYSRSVRDSRDRCPHLSVFHRLRRCGSSRVPTPTGSIQGRRERRCHLPQKGGYAVFALTKRAVP